MSDDTPVRQLPQVYVPDFPLAELETFPGNPKTHDLGLLDESFAANGFFGAILVQRRKWKPNQPCNKSGQVAHKARIVAGHGRYEQLRARGVSHAPVLVLECDDITARNILSIDNAAVEAGGTDDKLLADFLKGTLDLAGSLRGSGFDTDDLDDLFAALTPKEPEPAEPEPGQFIVVVTCTGEQHMQELYDELTARGLTVKLVT